MDNKMEMKLMIQKLLFSLQKIYYSIDVFAISDNRFILKGWMFSAKSEISDIRFIITDYKGKRHTLLGMDRISRKDVYHVFNNEYAEKSGFYASALIENCPEFKVTIEFKLNNKAKKLEVGKLQVDDAETSSSVCVTESLSVSTGFNLKEKLEEAEMLDIHKVDSDVIIDVIIPVFNGYSFLPVLLESIQHTEMKYDLYLIDDQSTDERVYPLLRKYADEHDNVVLLQNKENLGFVKTVNYGLSQSSHHVALVNSDVEVPENWLERLMYPILSDDTVASATPFTTCGTICSFPEFLKDNPLYLGLTVNEIDSSFKKVKPKYVSCPTGVGFCMGMSRKAIDEVGLFDAETFGKGYGEENDWCQRVIQHGYSNVLVDDLFVFHNHGGSFPSEEKRRYIEEHGELLLRKHPNYNKDVARFVTMDPNRSVREFVKLNLLIAHGNYDTILAFDHNIGGGASSYLEKKSKELVDEGKAVIVVRYDYQKGLYKIEYRYNDGIINCFVPFENGISLILDYFKVTEIWINELVTYPDLYSVLKDIQQSAAKHHIPVKMLFHDMFAICPTINLLDETDRYCGIPDCSKCKKCLEHNEFVKGIPYGSMEQWRREWKEFLMSCKNVIAFSENTASLINKAYPDVHNIEVIPHKIGYLPKISKKSKITRTFNVGLIGVLSKHKGEKIVEEMISIISRNDLNIRLILIGRSENLKNGKYFRQTGPYSRDSLPKMVMENDIDVFLISSICPETFSYTTEEVMTMGFPVMCFDLGAPAERIKKYDRGIVLPQTNAETVIKTITTNSIVQEAFHLPFEKRKILFVVEDYTYATRYRVYHLQEELLFKGIPSDCISIKDAATVELKEYTKVVVYRCSAIKEMEHFVKKCREQKLDIYYDIDDFVFDYHCLQNLDFLKDEEYKGFEAYTRNVNASMNLCDGFIVSTEVLKSVTSDFFPNKPVLVNRNRASFEMLLLSLEEVSSGHSEKVILGLFSGSNTHNRDFEMIAPVLLKKMKEHSQVGLLLGGHIQLPEEFKPFKDRIETFEFVDWKELPALLAKADINLMPLEPSVFHSCKSENKWMEAALVSVPTIASKNEELNLIIKDGYDGMLCGDETEWEEKLEKLIVSENDRNRIAENAHQRVINDYITDTIEDDVYHALVN